MADYPDYSSQVVDILTAADWAAVTGTDKNLVGIENGNSGADIYLISYTVPTGKTLYITQVSLTTLGTSCAIFLAVYNSTTAAYATVTGGYIGLFCPFPKPYSIPAGNVVKLLGRQYSGGADWLYGHIGGYEL